MGPTQSKASNDVSRNQTFSWRDPSQEPVPLPKPLFGAEGSAHIGESHPVTLASLIKT